MYFENASQRKTGEKIQWFLWQFRTSNGRISSHFDTIVAQKLSSHTDFEVLFHSMWSKYISAKNISRQYTTKPYELIMVNQTVI